VQGLDEGRGQNQNETQRQAFYIDLEAFNLALHALDDALISGEFIDDEFDSYRTSFNQAKQALKDYSEGK